MTKLEWMRRNYMQATEEDIDELREELLKKKETVGLNVHEDEDSILDLTEPVPEGHIPTRLTELQMVFSLAL